MSTRLSLVVRDRALLYECYMPFVQGGGLFVPTDADCELGEAVTVLLELMHEPAPLRVAGKIVWITPRGAQGNRVAGVGVRLDGQSDAVRRKIETYLAGAVGSERRTHTL